MPRTNSYRDDQDDRARAGADTLNRMEDRAMQERMLQYRISQDAEQSAYRAQRDQVEDQRYETQLGRFQAADKLTAEREKRYVTGAELENEVRRYNFEKQKALDENAKRLRVDLDRQAIEGNQALRDISLDDEKADEKLADWGVKYFRLLDPEVGDQRLQKQYELNQRLLERRRSERDRAAEAKLAREEKAAANRGTETIKEGDRTITRPLPAPGSFEAQQREHSTLEAALNAKSGKGVPAPEEINAINAIKKKLGYELLDSTGKVIPKAAVDVPVLTDKAQFDALPSGAFYVRDGRRFQKP